jgi:hypothetical protein
MSNEAQNGNFTKPMLAPVFDAMEYAYDHWGETLNDRGRLEDVDYIEEQIINAIEDWEDVIPDLKYRDRVNQAREINRKIDVLKKSNENKDAEIKELEKTLEFEMNKARNFNLNSIPSFSGGTAGNY